MHRFTTYTRGKLSTQEVSEDAVRFVIKDKHYLIEVDTKRSHRATLRLPVEGLMTGRILGSLDSSIQLKFFSLNKTEKHLLFEET